jgi:signal transduction histidine kinase
VERGDQLRFEISDDGVGYEVERVGSSGHGLANMSDRMAAFGGTVSVDSAIGRGTTVRGTLPIAERSR